MARHYGASAAAEPAQEIQLRMGIRKISSKLGMTQLSAVCVPEWRRPRLPG